MNRFGDRNILYGDWLLVSKLAVNFSRLRLIGGSRILQLRKIAQIVALASEMDTSDEAAAVRENPS